jgi:excisionase family DNA binding protein
MDLSAIEAAYVTGHGERTIRRHIADGSLRATKVKRVWRIDLDKLRKRYPIWPARLEEVERATHHAPPQRPARPVLVQQIASATQGDFPNRAQAAQWLARHGVNVLNPKNWHGWREVELTPAAVLRLAMSVQQTARWRIPWRLEKCGDKNCVCRVMLDGDG